MAIEPNPLRTEIVGEMHLRPSLAVCPPATIRQVVYLLAESDREDAIDRLQSIGISPAKDARSAMGSIGAVAVVWERHSEADTVSIIAPLDAQEPDVAAAIEWLESQSGTVLRAIRIDVVDKPEDAAALRDEYGFDPAESVAGEVGGVRFWSDFRLRQGNGYGRLLVQFDGTGTNHLGRTIQQLQELGNYRNLTLMGLPLVRSSSPALARAEAEAGDIVNAISSSGNDHEVLARLTALASEVAQMRQSTAFRLGATTAYGRIVSDRLTSLSPVSIPDWQSLEEFTNRRFLPALRTCENFSDRLESLSAKIEQATSLLRTRIEMAMQLQNCDLLRSLDQTSNRQLQLQRVVEGLSIFAVAYYATGLAAYFVEPSAVALKIDPKIAKAVLAMIIFVVVAAFVTLRKRSMHTPLSPRPTEFGQIEGKNQ